MAKDIGDLIVRLALDTSKFDDGLKRLESQMTAVQKQFMSGTTGITDFGKVTAKLQTSANTLNERLALQKEKVAQLETAFEESKRVKGEDAEETQKLAQKLEEARAKMNQTQQALDTVNQQLKLNQNGWYQLGVNLENVGAKLEKVGKKIAAVGMSASTKVTLPIMALGTACVKTFTDFDDSMRQVQATMGLVAGSSEDVDEQIKLLSDTAKEMGATTSFSASEAADALNFLASAGYDANQAVDALPTVLKLAQAGGIDLAASADLVTGSMATLGLEMGDLNHFTDELAKTANASNASVAQLGEAITTVGGTAKTLAGGTNELNTCLGILANNGLKGAEGGTHLRNMILSLSAPTDQAAAKMKQLGLTVFDADGKLRPMNAIFKDLSGTLGKMTQEDQTKVLSELFNKTDLTAANAMLQSCGEQFDTMSASIADCDGAASTMAATMEGGIGGSFRNLESAVEGLAIALGERLAPYIKAAAEKIAEMTQRLSELNPKTLDLLIKIAAIAAAVGPVLLVFGKLTSGIGTFMKILAPLAKVIGGAQLSTGALGTAFSVLTGPVGIIIAAIAGLVAVFVTLYNTNDEFRAKVQAIWAQICSAFENVRAVFQSTFERLKEAFAPVAEKLGELWTKAQEVFMKLAELLEPVLIAIGTMIGGFVATVVSCANGILGALAPLMSAVISAVDFVLNILDAIISVLQGDFAGAREALKAAFTSLWDVVVSVFTAIGDFFTGFWEAFLAICDGFGIDLTTFFAGLWDGIKAGVSAAWNGVAAWLSGAWQSICDTCAAVWSVLIGFFSGLWDSIKTAASAAWESICGAISGLWDGMKTTASTAWNAVCTNVKSAIDTGKAWITTAWENVKTAVSGVWDTVKTTASTAWNTVCTNVKSAIDGAKEGMSAAWGAISTAISGVWESLKTSASTAWNGLTSSVTGIINGAKQTIVTAWDNIKAGVKATWDGITGIFKSPIDAVTTWLNEKVAWFKGLFNFEWKLPSFKLPKIDVAWKEIGWGIKLPSLSLNWNALGGVFDKPTIFNTANAGMQGVGEAGPEAILPLGTLWQEMSVRLKAGMREILADVDRSKSAREEALLGALVAALQGGGDRSKPAPSVHVTQNIYANETSYAQQQREAARNFRQIAREMG